MCTFRDVCKEMQWSPECFLSCVQLLQVKRQQAEQISDSVLQAPVLGLQLPSQALLLQVSVPESQLHRPGGIAVQVELQVEVAGDVVHVLYEKLNVLFVVSLHGPPPPVPWFQKVDAPIEKIVLFDLLLLNNKIPAALLLRQFSLVWQSSSTHSCHSDADGLDRFGSDKGVE